MPQLLFGAAMCMGLLVWLLLYWHNHPKQARENCPVNHVPYSTCRAIERATLRTGYEGASWQWSLMTGKPERRRKYRIEC